MAIDDIIRGFTPVATGALRIGKRESPPRVAHDPQGLDLELTAGAALHLVVVHTTDSVAAIRCTLAEDAELELTHLFLAEAFAEVEIRQGARSRCRITTLELSSANASYRIALDGADAENELGAALLVGGEEHGVLKLRTSHNVADCRSNSTVKGVAGGRAVGEFSGMVYVAPDAQRTDARQQSRNILLSETARIDTQPQLEIYADDVKCTHGATVGQMDSEAIHYMRQRGLSESQARRLQIEGFVAEVVQRCSSEELAVTLAEAVSAKMEKM